MLDDVEEVAHFNWISRTENTSPCSAWIAFGNPLLQRFLSEAPCVLGSVRKVGIATGKKIAKP